MIQNKKICITGSIACGKSTVTGYLKDKGYCVIDADKITHELYDSSVDLKIKLKSAFGPEILEEGEISRKKLGKIIFENEEKRKQLEDIIHPMIFEKIAQKLEEFSHEKIIFLDMPLWWELSQKYRSFIRVDEVWCVVTTLHQQIERLMKRDNINKKEALQKINAQMDIQRKIELSDRILYNTKDIEFLHQQLNLFLREEGLQ